MAGLRLRPDQQKAVVQDPQCSVPECCVEVDDEKSTVSSTPIIKKQSSSSLQGGESCCEYVQRKCSDLKRQIPFVNKAVEMFNMCPRKVKVVLFSVWLVWKVGISLVMLYVVVSETSAQGGGGAAAVRSAWSSGRALSVSRTRVLYIVTTLAEFNNGKRATQKGQDRLGEVLIPVLVDSVESMTMPPFDYDVDVYLISAFPLKPEREQFIRDRLPVGVGLETWDNACPLGYEKRHSPDKVIDNTRALARQHRYVIKDKLADYDLFVAFEDDMRITGDHVSHYLKMSEKIDRLRLAAPESLPDVPESQESSTMKFYGDMTRSQLERVLPGFVRVEVLLNEAEHGAQLQLDNIDSTDFTFQTNDEYHFDPRICCHVQMNPNIQTPVHPSPRDVIIWETNIHAISARELPHSNDDWIGLLPGPGKRLPERDFIGGYWSGRDGAFGDEEKPSGGRPDLIAQQGGWMATRSQIMRMNYNLCMGTLLPPFDEPWYKEDGQESMNVEFWSGGYQLFTGVRGGCNMQRIISLRPEDFSKHFIYHVANNKQKQLNQNRMLRADDFLAQTNAVRKAAQRAKAGL